MKQKINLIVTVLCLFMFSEYSMAQQNVTFKFKNGCGIVKNKQSNSWFLKGTCTIDDLPYWAKNLVSNKNDNPQKLKKPGLSLNKEGKWELDTTLDAEDILMASANMNSVIWASQNNFNGDLSIRKITDQGKTWSVIHKAGESIINWKGLEHPDQQTIGVLADEWGGSSTRPVLLYSNDGGQSFTKDTSFGNWGNKGVSLSMYDDKHWAVYTRDTAGTYRLHISKDGGKTWNTQTINNTGNGVVKMRTPQKISLMGSGPTQVSADGGNTWDTFSRPKPLGNGFETGVSFTSPSTGYAVGRKDTIKGDWQKALIFKTTDGGRTWKRVFAKVLPSRLSPIPDGFFSIAFANQKKGIAVGRGAIVRTKDGGDTWMLDSIGSSLDDRFARLYKPVVYEENDTAELAITTNRGVVAKYEQFQSKTDTSGGNNTGIGSKGGDPNKASVAIFPNPAQSEVHIQWQGQSGANAALYNTQGKRVQSLQLNLGVEAYNLSGLKPGMYLLKIRYENRQLSKKLLIAE
jgi:photosystem II stability/assembly factor-like uncharacterized protein